MQFELSLQTIKVFPDKRFFIKTSFGADMASHMVNLLSLQNFEKLAPGLYRKALSLLYLGSVKSCKIRPALGKFWFPCIL